MRVARSHRRPAFWRRSALALAVVGALAAAGAGPARALIAGAFFVPPGLQRVAWAYPGLAPVRRQVMELGPWARTDYARFAGRAGVGELLFKTANYGPYVLQHAPGLERLARSWNHLRGRIRTWRPAGLVRSYRADTAFRRLVLDDGRSCVVFSGEGEPVPYDSQARPALVYFGYFCARAGVVLDDGAARRVVGAIRLTFDQRTPPVDRAASPEAAAIAKGSLAARTGNARFPFPLATPYNEVDPSWQRP